MERVGKVFWLLAESADRGLGVEEETRVRRRVDEVGVREGLGSEVFFRGKN